MVGVDEIMGTNVTGLCCPACELYVYKLDLSLGYHKLLRASSVSSIVVPVYHIWAYIIAVKRIAGIGIHTLST